MAVRWERSSGTRAAAPPQAASTWNQRLWSRASGGEFGEGIEGAGSGGSGGGDDEERSFAGGEVFGDGGAEGFGLHAEGVVDFDGAESGGAESAGAGGFEEGMMAFGGGVEDGVGGEGAKAGGGELGPAIGEGSEDGGLVGFGAAGGEDAVRRVAGPAESLGEGADEVELHFGGEGAVAPRGELGIEGGDESVGGDAHGGGRRVEEAVVARVRGVDLIAGERGGEAAEGLVGRGGVVEVEGLGDGADAGCVELGGDGEVFDAW